MFEHYFYPLSQRENRGWLERIRKYGDLGENFPSVKLKWQLFLVREKVTGLSCTNHKMPLNFLLSGKSGTPVIDTNGSEIFVRFCKSGGQREYQMENGSFRWNVCYAGYLHIISTSNCNASVLTARHFWHCALLNRNKSVARQFPSNLACARLSDSTVRTY